MDFMMYSEEIFGIKDLSERDGGVFISSMTPCDRIKHDY